MYDRQDKNLLSLNNTDTLISFHKDINGNSFSVCDLI